MRQLPASVRRIPQFEQLESRALLSLTSAMLEALGHSLVELTPAGSQSRAIRTQGPSDITSTGGNLAGETDGGEFPVHVNRGDPGEIRSVALDIVGDGFFIVQRQNGQTLYTTNGQFRLNANQELVTQDGLLVLGHTVDPDYELDSSRLAPLPIPFGSTTVRTTSNVFLAGNLSPEADVATEAGVIESSILSNGTIEVPDGTPVDFTTLLPPGISATTAAATTGGSVPAGTYTYRVSYFDGANETPSSAQLSPVTVGGADDAVQLSGLPTTPTDVSYTEQRIYRSDGTGPFTLVGQQPLGATFLDDQAAGTTVLDESAVDQANYSYYVTFYNTAELVESRPSAKLGPIAISDPGRRIQIENLPQPVPTPENGNFDAIRIYRNTVSESDTFYMVDELPAGSTTYVDQVDDATIEAGGSILDLEGPPITPGLALVDVVSRNGSNYQNIFEEGTLTFQGKKGGRQLEGKDLAITANTTVQDLIDFMDEAVGIVSGTSDANFPVPGNPGGEVTADGRISFTSNLGIENELQVDLSAFQLTPTGQWISDSVALQFANVVNADGQGATTDFVVFDSLGIAIIVRVTTYLEEKTGNSFTYRWMADSSSNEPDSPFGIDTAAGNGLLTFDGHGDLVSASQSTVIVDRRRSPSFSPLQFELDFSRVSGLPPAGTETPDTSTLAAIQQDGLPPGDLIRFRVAEDGRLWGVFNNASERQLGQLRLATFPSPHGLDRVGQHLYAATDESGDPTVGSPGIGQIGWIETLPARVTEQDTHDLSRERDISRFVLALTHPDAYEAVYSGEDRMSVCDANGDGLCNFGDLRPFADLLLVGTVGETELLDDGAGPLTGDMHRPASRPSHRTGYRGASVGAAGVTRVQDLALIAWLSSSSATS